MLKQLDKILCGSQFIVCNDMRWTESANLLAKTVHLRRLNRRIKTEKRNSNKSKEKEEIMLNHLFLDLSINSVILRMRAHILIESVPLVCR